MTLEDALRSMTAGPALVLGDRQLAAELELELIETTGDRALGSCVVLRASKSAPDIDLLADLRERLAPGGTLAILAVLPAEGAQSLAQAVRGAFRAAAQPVPAESLCGTLLCAGFDEVSVLRLDGWRGEALILGKRTRS